MRHWRYACFPWLVACACGTDASSSGETTSSAATSTSAVQSTSTSSAVSQGGTSSTASSSGETTQSESTASVTTTSNAASSTTTGATSTDGGVGGAQAVSSEGSTGGVAGTGGNSTVPAGTPVEGTVAEMPIARGEHGVGALNGEVYVLGGFTPQVTSSVQVYSPDTDSWRDAADFPVVFHHPNVASAGGLLYVLGFHAGMGQRMGDGSVYAYDPDADEWTPRASLPMGTERGASCVTTFNEKIYVFGGTNDVALAEASVYDPAMDSWDALPLLPVQRHHCIAAVVGDLIYIVSGRDVVIEEVQTESFVFDPVALTYTEVAPILTPRGGAAGGALAGRIYVFGGEGNVNDENGIFHEAEEYDPQTDSWSALPDMGVPRHGMGAAVIGDRMYVPGGSTSQGIEPQTTHSVYYFEAPE